MVVTPESREAIARVGAKAVALSPYLSSVTLGKI